MSDNLDRLKRILKAFFELHSITVSADSLRLWLDAFQAMPLDAIESAIRRFNQEATERPTPAAVRRYAGASALTDEQRAQAAWRVVRSTILRYGAYYRISFDDPLIHAAIRAIGGWTQLCNTASDELHWKAKAFVDAYVSVARSGIGEFQPLAGLLESKEPVEISTGLLPHATAGLIAMTKPAPRKVRIPDLSAARLKQLPKSPSTIQAATNLGGHPMPSPWRNGFQLTHTWRCECNRLISNKRKTCNKCGRVRREASNEPASLRNRSELNIDGDLHRNR